LSIYLKMQFLKKFSKFCKL